MKWRIRLSSFARRDIHQALEHTFERFGQAKHDQYRELIRLALCDIASNPLHRRSKPRPELAPDARVFHLTRPGSKARHLFVYRPADEGVIDVARLLHDAMDLKQHLPDDYQP